MTHEVGRQRVPGALWAGWLLAMALAGCGGGGGGTTEPPPPVTLTYVGSVSVAGPLGQPVAAPAGTPVRLVSVSPDGSVRQSLASAATDVEGRFQFTVAADAAPRTELLLLAEPAGRPPVRAAAFDWRVDVSPGSEAVVRRWLALVSARGAWPSENVTRLARLQRATAAFLDLTDLHASDDEAAQQELAWWLERDPAAQAALVALRSNGRLPASLDDIGAFHGLGRSAWQTAESNGGTPQFGVRWNAADGVYELRSSTLGTCEVDWVCGQPAATLRLEGDAVVQQSIGGLSRWGPAFDGLIGPLRLATIGAAPGTSERLMQVDTQTPDLADDVDQLAETFSYTLDRTVIGPARLEVEGRSVRALQVQTDERLVVRLSAGDEMRFHLQQTSWHLPFTGAVRTDLVLRSTDIAGRTEEHAATQTLTRALVNDMGWPSRLHITSHRAPIDRLDGPVVPIVLHPSGTLVYTLGPDLRDSQGLRAVDVATARVIAQATFPAVPQRIQAMLRVAPDRRQVYVGISRAPAALGLDERQMMSRAEADALGAMVLRFDTLALQESLRLTLPSRPSPNFAGQAYPRAVIDNLLPAPADGRLWALSARGLALYRDGERLPGVAEDPSAEAVIVDTGFMDLNEAQLLGWDPVTDELHANWSAYGASAALPDGRWSFAVAAQGLSTTAARAAPAFTACCQWSLTGAEHYRGTGVYFAGFTVAADRETGVLRPRPPLRGTSGNWFTACHALDDGLWCADSVTLSLLDLGGGQVLAHREMDWYLRRVTGSIGLASAPELLQPLAPGLWVAASRMTAEGDHFLPYVVIRAWPER